MINSVEKGKRGERAWAKVCRGQGFTEARRGQQYSGVDGEDVIGLPLIHQEVKYAERLNIYDAIKQSMGDADEGKLPIVAHRKNRQPWLVTMLADDWFKIYKEWIDCHG